jgi:hypothetical protein
MMMMLRDHKFELGTIVATPGAIELAEEHDVMFPELLSRHMVGDWGDICEEDRVQNEWSLEHGERLMSVYHVGDVGSPKLWVITERDRSVTTILKPSEY